MAHDDRGGRAGRSEDRPHPGAEAVRITVNGVALDGDLARPSGAAALVAAAERPSPVAAVVSRGGRPDLAGPALKGVMAPILLIAGGSDPQLLALNRQAAAWFVTYLRQMSVDPSVG